MQERHKEKAGEHEGSEAKGSRELKVEGKAGGVRSVQEDNDQKGLLHRQ